MADMCRTNSSLKAKAPAAFVDAFFWEGVHVLMAGCNTLQHTATQCNTLQHTSTHCNTLRKPAKMAEK